MISIADHAVKIQTTSESNPLNPFLVWRALCMRPAFAVAAPVRCASGANGMAGQRQSRSPRERAFASSSRRRSAIAASRDWSRREHRRACMQLVRHQRVEVCLPPSHHPPLLPGTQA